MGAYDARDRLRELGATDEELGRAPLPRARGAATDASHRHDSSAGSRRLVIIDAAAGAYDLQGLDDNKRADVERFARSFVRPFWRAGIATIVLDHVVRTPTSAATTRSARSARSAAPTSTSASRPSAGSTAAAAASTRSPRTRIASAWLPRPIAAELELRSDPETHALSWQVRPPKPVSATEPFRPTVLMERVSRYLEERAEPASRKNVEDAVQGATDWLRKAMDLLVKEGYASEAEGPRNARPLSSVRPFREADLAYDLAYGPSEHLASTSPTTSPTPEAHD